MATVRCNMRTTNRKVREPCRTVLGSRGVLGSRVLAQRNQAAVAVGAWVEGGTELREHPSVQASLTEELQEENQRRNEQNLRHFKENVRLRVAQQVRLRNRERPLVHTERLPQECPGATGLSAPGDGSSPCYGSAQRRVESGAGVRLRLACSRPLEPLASSHKAADHMWSGQEDIPSPAPHSCPLIQHKVSGPGFSHIDKSLSEVSASRVLWPLNNTEELKRQRQSQFLEQRRLFMNKEREHVKENQEHKKHILKTASMKSEKERARLEEERRLEEARVLYAAQQTLEQREQQVQEQLRLEAAAGQCHRDRKHSHRPKTLTRQINALRAQLRELLPGPGPELPPLCCCASFWESHPDTCANNCVFHNSPKAYIQALQAVVHSWELH